MKNPFSSICKILSTAKCAYVPSMVNGLDGDFCLKILLTNGKSYYFSKGKF